MSNAGAPTKYDPKYIKKVRSYLKKCKDIDYEYHKTRGIKSDSFEEKTKVCLPSKEGFARFIKISRKTLYNWADNNPEFAEALELIEVEQLTRLINRGLEGTYNPTIVKLILSSNHGMRENIDATSDGERINTFTDEQADRIAQRLVARTRVNDNSGI